MSTPATTNNILPYRRPSAAPSAWNSKHLEHKAQAGVDFRELLESVWTNSSDAMRVTDSEGTIVAVNDSYCRLVGMQTQELLGKPFTVVYDASIDSSALLGKYRSRFDAGAIQPMMNRLVRLRNGGEIFTETSNSYVKGNNGEGFVLSIKRDITERKQAEEALISSERKYYELFNNAMVGIFQSSVDGRLLIANAALLRMLGYDSFDELASCNLEEVYELPQQRRALSMMLTEKGSCSNVELKLKRRDGAVITVVERSRAVKDNEGNVVMFEGTLEDVTERIRMEEALAREQNLMRALMDNLPDHIYFKDTSSRFVRINRALARSFGLSDPAQAAGKTDFDFFTEEHARSAYENEHEIMTSCQPLVGFEEKETWPDGQDTWVSTTKMVLRDTKEQIIGTFGVSRDITEHKDLEKRVQESLSALHASRESLAHLNSQKDRLLSVLSHDLRSPFTSILGFCDILISDGESLTSTERSEFLAYIRDGAQRQLALLNKLLDWSRLETGRIKLDIQETDLDMIVASCMHTHLGTSKQKGITLQSTLPREMKCRGDQVLLMQAFNNLISNALKFTPADGVISIDLVEEKEDEWTVAVKDTGRGIPKEDIKKLFKVEEKYSRPGLDGEQGTGLGLSLVYEIIKLHNGSVSVESEVGRGSTFTIRLPRVAEKKEHVVLIVDDDEGIRVLHSRYLKKQFPDAQVIQASNGNEAFALAKQYRPRLIVTDYSMPEMNGYEFLNLIKGDPTTKHIPVFVITGKGSAASNETLRMIGAAAVMEKPVPSKVLQETIEKVLSEKV